MRVDRVDALVVGVGVVRRLDLGVLALLARLAALGQDAQDAVHAEDLAELVDGDIAADLDHRAAGELGLLHVDAVLAAEAEDAVARAQRSVPLPRAARHEHVHAAEHALGLRLDLVGDRVAEHRCLDVPDLGAVADLATPPGGRPVGLVGVQRVVVADAQRPVANRVLAGHRVQLAVPTGDVDVQQQPGLGDVFVGQLVLQGLLELLLELVVDLERIMCRRSFLGVAHHGS